MGVLLWPDGEVRLLRTMISPRTVEDLQLETIADAMAPSSFWRMSVSDLSRLWTDDPKVILYRQAVLRDFMENPELESLMETVLDSIDTWESHSGRSVRTANDRGGALDLWDFSFLDSYLQKVDTLEKALSGLTLNSAGMQAFREQIFRLRKSPRFQAIKDLFDRDFSGYSFPNRVTIGFNLDSSLKPVSLKLLRVPEKGEKGKRMSMTPSAMQTIRQVVAKAISDAGQSIGGFVRQESAPLRQVKQDIVFYLSAMQLMRKWEERGLPCCLPEICPAEAQRFETRGMFNPLLVQNGTEAIISNDVEFSPGGEILILTGANQGGKTVFLMSVALTQWLFQLGFMVPCTEARLSPVRQILTAFAPSLTGTSVGRSTGLLAEEAGRIAAVVNGLTQYCLVLLNEPLNATSPAENLYISREVLAALKAAGARGVWVTHLYELAADRERMNRLIAWGSSVGSLKIVVRSDQDGIQPTYKVVRGEPEWNSYAAEVLRRKELSEKT